MRVLVTGGGTGGHINPAIAIAQYIRKEQPNAEILYVGTPGGMEEGMAKKAGFDYASVKVKGFSRSLALREMLHNISALETAMRAKPRARAILREFKPDIVIGTGGYVSGPIVMEAARLRIKTALHEQNAFPGITNRLLARRVDIAFLAIDEVKTRMEGARQYITVGNPVKESIIYSMGKRQARAELGLDDRMVILSYGGSLGADALNRMSADLIAWHGKKGEIQHIHGFGRNGKEKFPLLLADRGVVLDKMPQVRVTEFIDNMDACMAAADLLICRSGAITISELQAAGKPAILVPSPNVTENHQFHNAMALVNKNAALLLEEKDYSKEVLVRMVEELHENPEMLATLSENASSMAILDTTKRIYDGLMTLV